MAETVRLSVIQSHFIPTLEGLKSDPFGDDFAIEDLFKQVERSITWYEGLFEQAAADKCDLTVVTEDFSRTIPASKYLDDRSVFRAVVEKQTPLIAERLGAAAKKHGMYIVACYYALEDEKIYNVADLFGPKGQIVGRYRKVHLPQYELWQVSAGDGFPVFQTDLGRVGMLICYDQVWPEATIACAMNGAQLICIPSAAVIPEYRMLARAADSQIHFASCCGQNSMIASPKGRILANAGSRQPAIISSDVDLKNASLDHEFFWANLFSGIRDHKERLLKYRRPDAYGVLADLRPPLADQYPEGMANTPEAIQAAYETFKEMHRKELRGENIPWGWHFD